MKRLEEDVERHEPPGDMPPAEFRPAAHAVADWIVDYLEGVDDYPVLARVAPGEIRDRLPPRIPREGEPFEAIFRDFEEVVLPGVTHWNHPSFFAYFAITGSAPGILGEMLAAALNLNAMVWRSSPVGTELEEVALAWLRDLLGLPEDVRGHHQRHGSPPPSTLWPLPGRPSFRKVGRPG